MDKEQKKINKLLQFYYDEEVIISLKIKLLSGLVVKGKISKKNRIGAKYIIVKNKEKDPIKIFLEDIVPDSIIPLNYQKKEKENKRNSLSPKLRHKVLSRDRFTCMGCGARAPDVELEVDHKIPVSRGGSDEMDNLTTLCKECNIGKGNKV